MGRVMKDSGVEWIGEIPDTWNVVKTSYLYEIVLGKMVQPEQQNPEDTYENYLCAANVGQNTLKLTALKQMWFSDVEKKSLELHKGDLLVVEGGDVASCDVIRQDIGALYFQNALHRVRGVNGNDNRFLRYILITAKARGYIDLICNKATIAHFSKEKFSALRIAVPCISEQEQISNYLDAQYAKIDSVIEKTRTSIEEYKRLKQAVITQAVTKGVRGDRPMKESGIEWLNQIPHEWQVLQLGNVTINMRNGYVGPTRDLFAATGVRYIQSLHVKDGKIDFIRHPYFVRESWANHHPKIYTGDLLIVQTGDIGQVALVPDEYNGCNCHALIIATPNSEIINPLYLMYYLLSSVGKELLLLYKTGALLPHLNSGKIKNTPVCVPSLNEQTEIVTYLDEKCAEIDALITKKEQLLTELERYKKSLIYEYVTGKKEVTP